MRRALVWLTYAAGIALILLLIGTALTRVIATAETIGRDGPDLLSVLLLVTWPVGGPRRAAGLRRRHLEPLLEAHPWRSSLSRAVQLLPRLRGTT